MPSDLSVSIIVCTFNRVAELKQTLAALGRLKIPREWKVEAIVVDNGSTDDTASVVRQTTLTNLQLRYLHEPNRGKSSALNAGLARARGEFLAFTDDDVLPAEDWLEQILAPVLQGQYDAVNGQITLAPHLLKPWMTAMHKMWLALSLDAGSRAWSRELIGANMAMRRTILERVPGFDLELGPGPKALGFCEDTLLGWQVAEAGFKIGYAPRATVVHQLDAARLRRKFWLNDARRRGHSAAYLHYHWEHADIKAPRLKWLLYWTKLQLKRIAQRPPPADGEGCPAWEMSCVMRMALCRQFILERRRPRNYQPRALTKRSSPEINALNGH